MKPVLKFRSSSNIHIYNFWIIKLIKHILQETNIFNDKSKQMPTENIYIGSCLSLLVWFSQNRLCNN